MRRTATATAARRSIASAHAASDNTVYARLTLDVGPENVGAMARKLGIRSPLTSREGAYVPSLGLGSVDVSPLDMASAYATLAAGGVYSRPMAIRGSSSRTARSTSGAGASPSAGA